MVFGASTSPPSFPRSEEAAIQVGPTSVRRTRSTPPKADAKSPPSIDGPRIRRMTVRPVPGDGWSLLVDDVEEPAWVVSTRAKAVEAARKAARAHQAQLVIEKRTARGGAQ